ncbi:molecular chaperone HtpG [Roseiarcus fermentans]|uniref:Chaperone protein HtpG n=1 Tax=Roseiarcus fermentans TaxID=1473586 RepID=A0A366F0Q1_9HYPH|nr:molecular chaperone HtpG [Roseiarcus fermentans]RBP08233.1 molecular chaperone HtpG [Roseiarcus fermentans]
MTADAKTPTNEAATTQSFEADVSRLLHLMVHSVYSDREIFVRELVSNAADACEKLRYEAIAAPGLIADGAPFAIVIALDKDAKTITVSDNGVGMTREDLTSGLGTIARSGTKAFLDKLAAEDAKSEAQALIGQFGIGFYSAFMVADEVVVETRRAGAEEAWRWSSDGKGSFTVSPLALDAAPLRGTRVVLHLNPEAEEFLEPWRVERIIRDHSGAVAVPVDFVAKPGEEPKRVADGSAIWTKPKSEVTPEQYAEFYRGLSGQFDEPALTLHWRAEGRHEYTVLAFIPGSRPFDLFDPARKGRNKLYVRRVLITEDADLLPGWLRFVRLVVDSADLPLNVSRELIQKSDAFAAIRKGVTSRVVQDLGKLAESEPEKFGKVWENFGAVIKEGLYEDPERRDGLFKIARFATTAHPAGGRTLADYVASLRENQTAIYYLTGDDAKRLAASPQLEGFRARGVEVLLLSDAVDSFWVSTAAGFDGKPFKSVSQGAADIKSIALVEGATPPAEASGEVATLLAFIKQTLEGEVAEVRASDRLTDSVACLIAPEFGPDRQLEKMLAAHGRLDERTKPILEVNPSHPLTVSLAGKLHAGQDKPLIEDSAHLILDEARLLEGGQVEDPPAFAARLRRVLEKALG